MEWGSSENRFRPGWKIKGFFYNGNCTNGSAGLIIGFGKSITVGGVVGVRLMRDDASRKCSIIFYHNGRCLGAGFCVDDSNDEFYPCLHVVEHDCFIFNSATTFRVLREKRQFTIMMTPTVEIGRSRRLSSARILGGCPLTTASMRQKVSLQKVAAASSEHDALCSVSARDQNLQLIWHSI